jgi:hypothetical protein
VSTARSMSPKGWGCQNELDCESFAICSHLRTAHHGRTVPRTHGSAERHATQSTVCRLPVCPVCHHAAARRMR